MSKTKCFAVVNNQNELKMCFYCEKIHTSVSSKGEDKLCYFLSYLSIWEYSSTKRKWSTA